MTMLRDEALAQGFSHARGYLGSTLVKPAAPIASAALVTFNNDAAATYYTSDITTPGIGCRVILYIATITGASHSVTVTIQGKDPVTGTYYDMLASAAVTATGTTRYSVYPGLTAVANVTLNDVMPPTWRVKHVHGGTCTTLTGSISAISF